MKPLRTLLVAASFVSLAAPVMADPIAGAAPRVVPGSFDPRTGAFRPIVSTTKSSAITPAVTGATFGGKFVTSFTITVASTFPTNTSIACLVSATAVDGSATGAPKIFEEFASVVATRPSATSATCTVTIPYSWQHITSPTSDMVELSYTLEGTTATSSTAFATLARTSSQSIGTIPLPANGKTTTNAITATI